MSTVIVTGARGYISTALTNRLAREGRALKLVSRSSFGPEVRNVDNAKAVYCQADLRDPRAWSELLSWADAVVHLSSRTDLRAAEADAAGDENSLGRARSRPCRGCAFGGDVALGDLRQHGDGRRRAPEASGRRDGSGRSVLGL